MMKQSYFSRFLMLWDKFERNPHGSQLPSSEVLFHKNRELGIILRSDGLMLEKCVVLHAYGIFGEYRFFPEELKIEYSMQGKPMGKAIFSERKYYLQAILLLLESFGGYGYYFHDNGMNTLNESNWETFDDLLDKKMI